MDGARWRRGVFAVGLCGCGPVASTTATGGGEADTSDAGDGADGPATDGGTGAADSTTSNGGDCDPQPPIDDDPPMPVWCSVEATAVTQLSGTAEVVFGTELGEPTTPIAWDGERVLFTFRGDTARDPDAPYEIRGSLQGDAVFDTVWTMPGSRWPAAIASTPAGTLVLAHAFVGPNYPDALLRLLPDGELEVLAELDEIDDEHPLVVVGDWAYVLLGEGDSDRRAARISLVGGGVEAFDFSVDTFAPAGDTLIGLRAHTDEYCFCGEMNCEWFCEGCADVVEWHDLLAFDPATARTSEVATGLCASGDDGPFAYQYRRVAITQDGFVLDDGPVVHLGFDGTRRVIAAPPGGIEQGQVVGEWIYVVSDLSVVDIDAHAIRRIPLIGGTTEELAQIPDAERHPITLGAVTPTHVYVHDRDTTDSDANVIRRVALPS